MANWQNVEADNDLVAMIEQGAEAAFKEATGQDMPEGFKNWSFRKMRGEYIFGIEMDAAAKALTPKVKGGGNVAKHDAETQKEIEAWVRYISAGKGKIQDAPEDLHAALSRALQPVKGSRMPPEEVKKPSRLPPEEVMAERPAPAKGTGMISSAALKAALKRAEKARKAG